MASPVERKLTAILSADGKGYSRPMGVDEAPARAGPVMRSSIVARAAVCPVLVTVLICGAVTTGTMAGVVSASKGSRLVFSGQVVSNFGGPVESAKVQINGQTVKTNPEGFFRIVVEDPDSDYVVMNVRKKGFGLLSRIYDRGIQRARWTMTKAATEAVDPTQAIRVRDTLSQSGCQGTLSSRIDWAKFPRQRIARVFDRNGQMITGQVPSHLLQAIQLLLSGTPCSPGISLSIPPNSLVDANGEPPAGKVQVSLSTVDLYSPDSMPGDYTVQVSRGNRFMQSYGAGTVEVSSGGQPYQLKAGATAELTIPVDPTQLKRAKSLEPTIPLLVYDTQLGVWKEEATATLNATRDAYVARINHFSEFNTDLIKTNQSCVKINTSGISGNFQLEVTIPMGGAAPAVRTYDVQPDTNNPNPNLHAIFNLPSNTWISMIPIRENPPGTFTPLGIFVVNTGLPQNPSTPNRPAYNYSACQSQLALTEIPGDIKISVAAAGAQHRFGPLPAHFYALADPTGTDVYPLGAGGFALFSLFDTGSTRVAISNVVPNRLTGPNFGNTDAGHLGLTGTANVRLRLNGLGARDPLTGNIPIGPLGSGNEPQVELSGITAEVRNVNVTLIGVPVIHQVVVHLDNSNLITDSTGVVGPDITFYLPGNPGIPLSHLVLDLGRFGLPQRFLLRKVAFKNGAGIVDDQDPTVNPPYQFQFDTGTTATIINDRVAGVLGLTAGTGSFDCFQTNDKVGYAIDSITMTGTGGTYTINNPSVCWDESTIGASAVIDGVIGSNLFDQVELVFDGAGNTLGIVSPGPTP